MAKETNLPDEYRPLSMWEYFGYSLLYSIPFVGWVFMVIFALSDKNINRRNYTRSFFVTFIIGIILIITLITSGVIVSIPENIIR